MTAPHIVKLVATTEEARASLGERPEVYAETFPFNVGRECRVANQARPGMTDLRVGAAPQINDVYLLGSKPTHSRHISREHFAIDYADHRFILVDRGSACGTIVAGKQVGGDQTGGRTELQHRDEIVVGTNASPFLFRFEIVSEHLTDLLPDSVQTPPAHPSVLRGG